MDDDEPLPKVNVKIETPDGYGATQAPNKAHRQSSLEAPLPPVPGTPSTTTYAVSQNVATSMKQSEKARKKAKLLLSLEKAKIRRQLEEAKLNRQLEEIEFQEQLMELDDELQG